MIIGHIVYSVAIAILFGMIYRRITGREYSWIIIMSAYAPDADVFIATILGHLNITLLVYGSPINHGDFHNISVLLVYAIIIAFLFHPMRIRFIDSFIFASVGFAAHLFEDALVFKTGYRFLWPLTDEKFGIGLFSYDKSELYGFGDGTVVATGLVLIAISVFIRTAYEGRGWMGKMIRLESGL